MTTTSIGTDAMRFHQALAADWIGRIDIDGTQRFDRPARADGGATLALAVTFTRDGRFIGGTFTAVAGETTKSVELLDIDHAIKRAGR